MPISNQIYSILVPAASANFTAHTYSQVYAGAAAAPVINGVAITMAAGSSLNVNVRSISATADVYLLGESWTIGNGATGNFIFG